jgi:hypothetical protein
MIGEYRFSLIGAPSGEAALAHKHHRPDAPLLRRGLHYVIVVRGNVRKPNGEIYRNTDEDWEWLSTVAGKAARWLGYIPFERILDNRNAEPIIHRKARVVPWAFVTIGVEVAIPDVDDLQPAPIAQGFVARQAYHF